ncbi:MAG: DUF4126 domain-containing protein [Betaproteobacteria bacterium]
MDLIHQIAMGAGLAWASGIRLYAVLFLVGILGHFGLIGLPAGLHVLTHPLVMSVAGGLFLIEFFADKIPGFDSLWDGIHTFIRIPAGAILAAATFSDVDPALMLAAGLIGGTIASGSHLAKAGSRAMINTSPEPFSNWAASFGEEAVVLGGLWTMIMHPVAFLVLLVLFLGLAAWLLPKLWRGVRTLARRLGYGTAPTRAG